MKCSLGMKKTISQLQWLRLSLSIILTAAAFFGALKAYADVLPPEARLRKLSLQLRGTVPLAEEFQRLEAAKRGGALERYFYRQAEAYLKSPAAKKLLRQERDLQSYWNGYIGQDIAMSPSRRRDLLLLTERSKDPIKIVLYLVSLPEFYDTGFLGDPLTFSSVKNFFQACTQCHVQSQEQLPRFSKMPFSDFEPAKDGDHLYFLTRVADMLDLAHDGAAPSMPPKRAGWTVSAAERKILIRWLRQGARNERGAVSLTPGEMQELFKSLSGR